MTVPSRIELQRLLTLGRIVQLCDTAGNQAVSNNVVLEASPEGTDAREIRADLEALEDCGYVDVDERFNGAWLARITNLGRKAWAELESVRSSPRDRRRKMRDEYLIWLYNQDESGLSPTSDDFLTTGASFLGLAYTQDDLERTGEWLLERGFIKGPKVWQRPDPIRPQITAKGQVYVEEERSVHESPASVGSTTFHNTINGPAMLAQNSQHVAQTQNVNDWKDDARRLAEAVQQLAQLLPDGTLLAEYGTKLRAEVEGDARPTRIRVLVDSIVKALGTGAGGAIGGALVTQAVGLLGSLPL
jgi:hypothetical protein